MNTNSSSRKGRRHSNSNGHSLFAQKIYWAKRRFAWAVALLGVILLAVVLASSPISAAGATKKDPPATPVSGDGSLVYLEADAHGRPRAIVKKPRDDLDALPAKQDTSSVLAATNVPGRCEISGLHAAPKGQWVAVQVNCEDGGFVQVVHAASGQVRNLDADLNRDSIFLGWAPTGNEMIVKVDVISNPRVYLVNVASGKAEQLPVPWSTYNVALSRNGKRMICSLTRGLGYGSETWIADVDGQNAKRVLMDPTHIIAFAHWSPSGDKIAYIRMPDSNIPFTVGELWVMDGEGNNPVLLGEADAGHGYEPAWSPDGEQIAFVVRENPHDRAADQQAAKLVSNVYIANVNDRAVSAVTQFEGALTETPTWSSDGEFLAFSTTAEDGTDVWAFKVKGQKLHRVTHRANAWHPTWLSDK